MSETLNAPWIADYLINIAETYGCNLHNIPVHLRPGKKVQLIQFLTFAHADLDDCIWAYVSDKNQKIAVRFSRHAMAEYNRDNQPDSQGKRFTQQYCAIATIKSFKPIFQRIPSGQQGRLTVLENLALDVDQVKIVGGAGEPEFGSPKALEDHRELKQWIEGLRVGGGDGNVLKLRKAERLAREQEEASVSGTLDPHEQNGHGSGQQIDVAISMNRAVQSDHQAIVKQGEDWRESIAKKPLRFYKRPTGNGVTASKPTPTGLNHKNGNSVPRVKRGKGALDLDSSPVVAHATFNGSPARSERQTTPSDWAASPSLGRSNIRPSPSPEAAEEQQIFQLLTPPLFSPEKPPEITGQLTRISHPAANNSPQATPASVQQTNSNGSQSTSLKPPTPAQRRRGTVPLSSSFAVPSLSPVKKGTSLPPKSVFPARMVPPPSVKNTKEACGEVLVPDSDAGGTGTQSSSTGNSSSLSRRHLTIASGPGDVIGSSKLGSSPERTNKTSDGQSPALESGLNPELDKDKEHLDDLSRMAVNGSCAENLQGNGIQARNNVGDNNKVDAVHPASLPSPVPEPSYEPLPPSSLPIHSQSPSWYRSTTLVEETVVTDRRPTHATALHLPTNKRTRPLSPSPLRSKRPRLMSREPDSSDHQIRGRTLRKAFDPELLKVGIKVDLADYDDNPPPYPWGEGLPRLGLKAPDYPLLITNSKLAEIRKSVCASRGWHTKSKLVNS